MDRAKEAIIKAFNENEERYSDIFKIIDERWECQLHWPLHAAGHFLNSKYFYFDLDIATNHEITARLYACIQRLVPSIEIQDKIMAELPMYKKAEGLFGIQLALRSRKTRAPEKLRELAWSGILDYMRPDVWWLLLGYAPPNSDRKEGDLRRKRHEYLGCLSQYYGIPDIERLDDEINMLCQIAVDYCPCTVPDVSFFQEPQVQKSLERILYTWAIRHPASGYVRRINDLATPFLVGLLSEYLEGGADNGQSLIYLWKISLT